MALRPDVIFGAFDRVEKLERDAGLTVVTLGRPGGFVASIAEVLDAIRAIDRVLHGDAERSDRLVARLSGEIGDVERRVKGRPRRQVAFVYVPRRWAPTVAGKNTPEHDLLLRAGAENLFADVDSYKAVSLEALISLDPEVLVTNIDHVSHALEDPRFQGLRAVKRRQVIGVKASRITSSRFTLTLRNLARKLHPSAFSE